VICVDNLETGSLANIEHIRTPEFVHLSLDIIEPYFVEERSTSSTTSPSPPRRSTTCAFRSTR